MIICRMDALQYHKNNYVTILARIITVIWWQRMSNLIVFSLFYYVLQPQETKQDRETEPQFESVIFLVM